MKQAARNELKSLTTDKLEPLIEGDVINIRVDRDVAAMINRAMRDFATRSKLCNAALRLALTKSGYGTLKKDSAADEKVAA